jgi:hypothetical protein
MRLSVIGGGWSVGTPPSGALPPREEDMKTTAIMLTALVVSGVAGPAAAGEPIRDHLACHKVSDPSRYYAIVNLDAGFEAEAVGIADPSGCYVKLRGMKLCVPVAKSVTETDATILPVVGQDLVNGFLCYKMRCPKAVPAEVGTGDQFGVRTVVVNTAVELCTPVDY